MSDRIDPLFREWLIKEKLSHSIAARFLVRFHVSLILAGSIGVGWVANRVLYHAGLKDMLVRHPVVVVLAYLGFIAGLQLWIRYSGIRDYMNSRRSSELLEPQGFGPRNRNPPDWSAPADIPLAGDGCALLLGFLAVGAIAFAMGGYLIVFAADVMAELVFELLLAAGLIRGIRRVDMLASAGIPRITLWALAVALAVSVVFALYARKAHPGATTIGEVVREMIGSKRTR